MMKIHTKTVMLGLGIMACAGQARAGTEGSLDKDVIREVVRAHLDEIRGCYNGALARDPEAHGSMMVDFTITADGSVSGATVAESTMDDPQALTCIGDAVTSWVFPQPSGGVVVVRYPFVLEPG